MTSRLFPLFPARREGVVDGRYSDSRCNDRHDLLRNAFEIERPWKTCRVQSIIQNVDAIGHNFLTNAVIEPGPSFLNGQRAHSVESQHLEKVCRRIRIQDNRVVSRLEIDRIGSEAHL